MNEIEITAKSVEAAVEEAMRRFHLPREAIKVIGKQEGMDDTLEGEEPLETRVKIGLESNYFLDAARERVGGLLRRMGLKAEIRGRIAGNIIRLQVTTNNNSVLIGKRGQNLEAIEHIINRMINRGERELPYVLVDVEKYRERRHGTLEAVARRAAQKALRTGRDVALEPMPPDDRKLVHNLLKTFRGVSTSSMGREGSRYVIVSPEGQGARPAARRDSSPADPPAE
jgi:spoIIIJ-associated protein